MMTIKTFLIYWIIWNFYWSIPYSFFWQWFSVQKKKWAVILSLVVFLYICQFIVPFIIFTHLFEIDYRSVFTLCGSFLLLCIPGVVCNKLVPKLSAIKLVAVLYAPVAIVVMLGWQYFWATYLDAMIIDPAQRFFNLGLWGIVIPFWSALFIRIFLKSNPLQRKGVTH